MMTMELLQRSPSPTRAQHGYTWMRTGFMWVWALLMFGWALPTQAQSALNAQQMADLLAKIDDAQRNGGDFRAQYYIERKEKDKTDVAQEAIIFRRDADDKLMILFTKPKSEQGKGYLRLDKNLWFFDPSSGKWERRTERERIGGTDTRRADFDESRLSEEYDPIYKGQEKLGVYTVHHLELKVKAGVDVSFPVLHLWVDVSNNTVLKRQEYALSGKLMRTSLYPRWKKLYSESKKADVWFPEEMRFYDEIEKSNATTVVMRTIDLRPLEANMFTKAWLESKAR